MTGRPHGNEKSFQWSNSKSGFDTHSSVSARTEELMCVTQTLHEYRLSDGRFPRWSSPLKAGSSGRPEPQGPMLRNTRSGFVFPISVNQRVIVGYNVGRGRELSTYLHFVISVSSPRRLAYCVPWKQVVKSGRRGTYGRPPLMSVLLAQFANTDLLFSLFTGLANLDPKPPVQHPKNA